MNKRSMTLGTLVCLSGLLGAPAALAQSGSTDAQREAWVVKARQGERDAAIDGLKALYARTGDTRVLDDLIALLVRAGRLEEALNACGPCRAEDYSETSLVALGGAARQLGRPERAQEFFRELTLRDPNNPQGWLGLALTHTDLGNVESAGWALARYEETFGRTDEYLEARAYLAARTDNTLGELQARQRLVERQPENDQEVKALYRLAVTLGASAAAQRMMSEHPDVFTEADRLWLRYYDAVASLRLADSTGDLSHAEQGLAGLNAVIADERSAPGLVQRAEYDKVVALATLRRFRDAEALAATLETRYGPLPNYVQEARADALSGLGRPGEARRLYQSLVASNPGKARDVDHPLYESLIYAYADAQQYGRANDLLERWKAEEPATRWDFTGTRRIDNPNFEKVRYLEVMLTAWRGDEDGAEAQLDDYLAEAPGSASLWRIKGDLYRWRGWPRQAEQAYREAADRRPPDSRQAADYGILGARLDRGQWRDTVAAIKQEVATRPPSVALEGLERDWREQRAGKLSIQAERGDTQGNGVQSSRDWRYETRLDAPRNDAGSRFFAQRIGIYGKYNGDNLYAAYDAAGYEFNLYPATLSLAVGQGAQLNEDWLAWGRFNYAFSDFWSINASAELNTAQTPLRALNDDIQADRYSLGVKYRRDEKGEGGLGLALTDFDDGNLRREAFAYWDEDLIHHDAWRLNGQLFVGGSQNDTLTTSYYNPASDISTSGQLALSYLLPLGYRKGFTQTLTLGGGNYWQENYGSNATWQIGYAHQWTFEPDLLLSYGIARQKAVYDGDPEYGNFITAGIEWRFL